jgi:uncharacterized protein (DUF1697 family)
VSASHVALLRAVNVAGKNMLPMKDLAAMFTETGCTDVSTYIQSGNVLFTPPASVATLPEVIGEEIRVCFGLDVAIVVRTAGQLVDVVHRNPFGDADSLYVLFLQDAPDPDLIATLAPDRSPPDRFVVSGSEVYLHLPNGAGRTKLTAQYFESKLRTRGTARNWRTVMTLAHLTADCGSIGSGAAQE